MFLRAMTRFKDGKAHRWSIVESRRTAGGRVVHRHVLYLGEINDSQKAAWCRTIEVFDEGCRGPAQLALFPEDRDAPPLDCNVVQIRLGELQLHRPRRSGYGLAQMGFFEPVALLLDSSTGGKAEPIIGPPKTPMATSACVDHCYHI